MLQFITDNDSRYTPAEQAQMFSEAGGMWVQMAVPKDNSGFRDEINMVAEICRSEESFLILEHDVELVNELKVHGVHLMPGDMLPKEAREMLGPHAVIGVTVSSAEEVIALRGADIDYVQIGPFPRVSLENYRDIVSKLKEAGVQIPVVATGDITKDNIKDVLAAGVNGIAVSNAPLESDNPVAYFRELFGRIG